MTDIKVGDYVRHVREGEVYQIRTGLVGSIAHIRLDKGGVVAVYADECTVIDPPVRVGDVISYEKALTLPYNSVVFGMESHASYQVGVNTLWHGVVRMTERGGHQQRQEYEVLKIMREK